MKRFINVICFITLNLYLTACGSSGSPSAESKAPAAVIPPSLTPPQGGGPQSFSGTYYTLSKTATVSQGGHTYHITMTGHCVAYNSDDYCWDDGWQTIPQINYEQDFWQLCKLAGSVGQCSGGGSTDPVAMTPTPWTQMAAYLVTPPFQPSDVYTQGVAASVTCTLTGSIIDCVDFQIDTAQAPL